MKSSTLKRLYKKYNRKYFNNLLPIDNVDIRFADIGDDVCGFAAPWNAEIELRSGLSILEIPGTLLHEMIHFYQYFIEDKELDDEKDHHDIEFYFHAQYLYELTGYQIA